MDKFFYILVLLLILILGAIFLYLMAKEEEKRREAYRQWAHHRGWNYYPQKDREIYQHYSFLQGLCKGSNRYVIHTVRGKWKNYPALAFTFHYATHRRNSKGIRRTQHHHFGVILIHLERRFPPLQIYPAHFLEKLGAFFGLAVDGISFESIEFSDRFTVRSSERRFAYDFCHPQMIEYILEDPNTHLEMADNVLAVYTQKRLEVDDLDAYLHHIYRLRSLMPRYLFVD